MEFEQQNSMRLDEFADLNPPRPLKKGAIAKLIDMAALPTSNRSIELSCIETRPYSSGARFRNGDSLLARITPCLENGKSAFVSCLQKDEVAAGSTEFIVIAPKREIEADFVYYASRFSEFRQYAISRMEGTSGRQRVSHHSIADFAFPYIDPEDRVAIGRMLRSLDDRIDHNRALAANLEAIARRLFKSWFVDFDPVRAKAAGEKPAGLADDIAALFPDRLVDSELGEIPEGWRIAQLADLIEVERGLSYKGAGLADSETGKPMHNLNSVLEGGGYKYAGIKFYNGNYKERHIARAGDIIVANTEQGHKHMLIGFPAIIPTSYEEGLFSHHLYRVRLLPNALATNYWLYHTLMAPDVREQVIGHANGSTVNMLKSTGLQAPLVAVPPLALCRRFDEIAKALYDRIETSISESAVLANLRDLLLPRLISGKLRIEDAETMLEEAIA